jgi:ABC-type phosphate/phosphonate transport system substrate-binding protein
MHTTISVLENIRLRDWLSTTRSWIQRNKINGSDVTWGSDDVLNPPMTVRELEEVTLKAVAAALNEYDKELERQKKISEVNSFDKHNAIPLD